MKFGQDGIEYRIVFSHEQCPDGPRIKSVTTCRIVVKVNGTIQLWSSGYAYCSVKDVFSKETGRKVALTRALKEFDKEFRTRAWKAYLGRKVQEVRAAQ